MKKLNFILFSLIAIFFNGNIYAQFGPLTQASSMSRNYSECQPCKDPWVGEVYFKIWGACASSSGGQNDACNIANWNNGKWDSYENLKNIVRGKYTGKIANGNVYIFTRTDAVQTKLGPAGHIGWGFQLSDGSFFAGSTENPMIKTADAKNWTEAYQNWVRTSANSYWVSAGKDNGFWSQRFANEQDMLSYMKNYRAYDKYKAIGWPNPDLVRGKLRAEECMIKGFQGVSNNCLDHTYYVLEGLGLKDMPWKQWHPTPNGWFNEWYKNITQKGKNL